MVADMGGSGFRETYAVHAAVRSAVRGRVYAKDHTARKAAERLLKHLESDKSTYGRQCRMIRLMTKGATVEQLGRGLRCSRRTIFRYLVELENAGVSVELEDGVYRVPQGLLRLVS